MLTLPYVCMRMMDVHACMLTWEVDAPNAKLSIDAGRQTEKQGKTEDSKKGIGMSEPLM